MVTWCKRRLADDFPGLEAETVEPIGQGWDHVAVEVDGKLVFRLPRDGDGCADPPHCVSHEIEVLRRLQGKLPVAAPDPLYIAPGRSYFGYPKLPGRLVVDLRPTFTAQDERQLRRDWVKIASVIHAQMPLDVAKEISVPTFDPARSLELASIAEADPSLSDEVRRFADTTVRAVLRIEPEKQALFFLHNDLHFQNVLADPGTKRVTGVLDWSDCCIGPVAREFAIWEWGHDGSLPEVAAMYEAVTGVVVDIRQAKLWKHLEELADLVEQREAGDESGARDSLGHVERWIAA